MFSAFSGFCGKQQQIHVKGLLHSFDDLAGIELFILFFCLFIVRFPLNIIEGTVNTGIADSVFLFLAVSRKIDHAFPTGNLFFTDFISLRKAWRIRNGSIRYSDDRSVLIHTGLKIRTAPDLSGTGLRFQSHFFHVPSYVVLRDKVHQRNCLFKRPAQGFYFKSSCPHIELRVNIEIG